MKVRYVKSWNKSVNQSWFTIGKEYEVIEQDVDADFFVINDENTRSLLLQSEVEVIKDEPQTDSIVGSVINQFKQRSEAGINKYGTTLDRNDLSILEWIKEAQQEAMDFCLYLEKLHKELAKNQQFHYICNMRNVFIYLITNPVGKFYVGSTVNLKDRVYRYKTLRVKSQVKIFNSLKKYGWDNHEFKVIHECDIADRNYYESYYGNMYNCIGENGLNLSLPKINETYICMSDETKRKIGNAHKGKTISDANKKLISEFTKKRIKENGHPMKGKTPWNKGKEFLSGEKNPMFGVTRSEEWKKEHSERMTKINKKGSEHPRSRVVLDTITGVHYQSLKEASEINGIKYSSIKTMMQRGNERFIYLEKLKHELK